MALKQVGQGSALRFDLLIPGRQLALFDKRGDV